MRLAWTRLAVSDRQRIRHHIAQDNPRAAVALDELIGAKAGRLVVNPELGRPGRVAGTRELVAHRNYVLIYDLTPDLVRILRILHVARRWPTDEGPQG